MPAVDLTWTAASKSSSTLSGYRVRKNGVVIASTGTGRYHRDQSATPGDSYDVIADFANQSTILSAPQIFQAPVVVEPDPTDPGTPSTGAYGYRYTVGPQPGVSQPTGAVVINVSADEASLAAQIAATSSSATLWFAPGVHRTNTRLVPKANQTWLSAGGATISGAALISSSGWSALSGSRWSKVVSTLPTTPATFTEPTGTQVNAMAKYREDVWVDKKGMWRVATAAEVTAPDRYHVDYATQTVTIGVDPVGKVIEHARPMINSSVGRMVDSSASGVTMRNLTFEGFMPDNNSGGFVLNSGSSITWTIEDCRFRMSHYGLVALFSAESVSTPHMIRRNIFEEGGGLSIGANRGGGWTFTDNLVQRINYNGFRTGWDASGLKFTRASNCTVAYSTFLNIEGTAIWSDIETMAFHMHHNYIKGTAHHGLHHEIGFDAIIEDNYVEDCLHDGLKINVSRDSIIRRNKLVNCGKEYDGDPGEGHAAIIVIDGDRIPSSQGGADNYSGEPRPGAPTRRGINNTITQNEIVMTIPPGTGQVGTGGYAGTLQRYSGAVAESLTTNVWSNNKYNFASTTWAAFQHNGSNETFAQRQAAGRDVGSTLNTAATSSSVRSVAWGIYRAAASASQLPPVEEWVGRTADVALDFQADDSPSNLAWPSWQSGNWSARRMLLGTTLTPTTNATHADWSAAANGSMDATWQNFGSRLVSTGQEDAILRGNHEFNGGWFNHRVQPGEEANYILAFRRQHGILKAIAGQAFTFGWNPTHGYQWLSDPRTAYPGDAYVDVIMLDVYDDWYNRGWKKGGTGTQAPPTTAEQQAVWNEILNGQRGLNFWAQFARDHNKPLMLPEWGIRHWTEGDGLIHGGGDNPIFVQGMHDFITNPANNVVLHAPWEDPGQGFYDTNLPATAARAKYVQLFHGPRPSGYTALSAPVVGGYVAPVTAPGAPSSVTATLQGGDDVSVSFVPATTGTTATSFTATASPGGKSATDIASPIVVPDLPVGVAVTFRVTAHAGNLTSAQSAASNSVTPVASASTDHVVTWKKKSGRTETVTQPDSTTYRFTATESGNVEAEAASIPVTPGSTVDVIITARRGSGLGGGLVSVNHMTSAGSFVRNTGSQAIAGFGPTTTWAEYTYRVTVGADVSRLVIMPAIYGADATEWVEFGTTLKVKNI